MSNFNEVESLLSQLLIVAAPVLSDSERAEVQRFIDVGEYGLALETAAAIYSEEKKIATAEVVDLIECLAAAMSMDPVPLLEGVPK
jgi:dihydroxyacetone kinase DhaKLM complex PTS-EIIA-like component DhaM